MISAEQCYSIFEQCVHDYHLTDSVDAAAINPFQEGTLQSLLYAKTWVDAVQWHLEDLVRKPGILPEHGLAIKHRIDKSNQQRTDLVELLDDYFVAHFRQVKPQPDARLNSETPAWLLDRMSILSLKIYHMEEQTRREDASAEHREVCKNKLVVLLEQRGDMITAFTQLMEDIGKGIRWFKVYRQMKMYNDPSLNPMLYKSAE